MNKKINRIEVRQTAQKAAIRDEQNRRIQFAATHPIQETLGYLNTTLCGDVYKRQGLYRRYTQRDRGKLKKYVTII